MSVERINGRWQFRVVGRFVDDTSLRVTGAAPKNENTRAAALHAESQAIAWMATQPRPATLAQEVSSLAIKKLRALAAEAAEASLEAYAAITAPPATVEIPTLTAFWPTYEGATRLEVKPSSMDSKEGIAETHLLPRLGHLRVDQIVYSVIQDLKVALSKTPARRRKGKMLSRKTINNILGVLCHLLDVARLRGLIAAVPEIKWLKLPRPSFRWLSFDEADRLVAGADGEWATMLLVAVRTGMRMGELLGLHWEDVDLDAGCLHVRRNLVKGIYGTPKSGKDREIGLGDDVVAALRLHRHIRGPNVFCDSEGRPFTKGALARPLLRACRAAEIKPHGWHVLRHTFASHLIMQGVHQKAVQELLGHATIAMTDRYTHLAPEVKREAVRLLDRGVRSSISVVANDAGKELAKIAA